MPLQTMDDGKVLYIVDLPTGYLAMLPFVGTGVEQYYAEALNLSIYLGFIKKPGKYGIEILWDQDKQFRVYEVLDGGPYDRRPLQVPEDVREQIARLNEEAI